MTPEELKNTLPHFTGTEHRHKYSSLFPNFLITDGVKFLADEAGAYWLIDAIGSYRSSYRDAGFALAVFGKNSTYPGGWALRIVDDIQSNTVYAFQEIEHLDFPLDEIKLYVINDGTHWVILLPSEY